MREYSPLISLVKNSRGVYCLDTSIGCASGLKDNAKGCYHDCYAAKSAKLYGYNFGKTVLRSFKDERHRRYIISQINKIPLPFVRIGASGDPSENWDHTVSILRNIKNVNKEVVLITKHWTQLTDEHLDFIRTMNVCINTSVSALDSPQLLASSLFEYHRVKPFCKSILRVVSADFNLDSEDGKRLSAIQDGLFNNEEIIDTVLRVGRNNPYVTNGVINVTKSKFLGKNCLISKKNRKTYFGKCGSCIEMCGAAMTPNSHTNKSEVPRYLQQTLI